NLRNGRRSAGARDRETHERGGVDPGSCRESEIVAGFYLEGAWAVWPDGRGHHVVGRQVVVDRVGERRSPEQHDEATDDRGGGATNHVTFSLGAQGASER